MQGGLGVLFRECKRHKADMILVGQTPPPFHGQALGVKSIADYPFSRLRLRLVRMAFSDDLSSVGRFRLYKIWHLVALVFRILAARWQSGAAMMYYAPAGPRWTPVLRDLILLPLVRPFFAVTVFHFRAAGLGRWLEKQSRPVRWLARLAYGRAELAILMSARLAEDGGGLLNARHTTVIPNGVVDLTDGRRAASRRRPGRILFVGALRPEKGVDTLVDALMLLHTKGIDFSSQLVGKPASEQYKAHLQGKIAKAGLASRVTLCGELTGQQLYDMYANASVFCLPTQYESEAMPRVIIEAMQFALPVVATAWRGIPDMIENETQGLLTPTGDAAALAAALENVLLDPRLGETMGAAGRQRYDVSFTLEKQMLAFEKAAMALLPPDRAGKSTAQN
jgi:glycosyltransferase involved in cell wall biosynthesis